SAILAATVSAARFIETEDELWIARGPVAVDLGTAADAPCPLEQVPAQLELAGLPSPECALDVVLLFKRSCQLPPGSRRLGGSRAAAAALAVPAAAWGRTTNAASPIRQTRPNAICGTSTSSIAWTKGARTASTTLAICAGSLAAAVAHISSMCSARGPSGGSEI